MTNKSRTFHIHFITYTTIRTGGPAVAKNEPIVRRCLDQPCSTLTTMTIPDVEILYQAVPVRRSNDDTRNVPVATEDCRSRSNADKSQAGVAGPCGEAVDRSVLSRWQQRTSTIYGGTSWARSIGLSSGSGSRIRGWRDKCRVCVWQRGELLVLNIRPSTGFIHHTDETRMSNETHLPCVTFSAIRLLKQHVPNFEF